MPSTGAPIRLVVPPESSTQTSLAPSGLGSDLPEGFGRGAGAGAGLRVIAGNDPEPGMGGGCRVRAARSVRPQARHRVRPACATAAWAIGSAALPSAMIQRGAPPEGGRRPGDADRAGAGFNRRRGQAYRSARSAARGGGGHRRGQARAPGL